MIAVDVRSNISSVLAEFRADTREVVSTATVRALNRALDQSATAGTREIRKRYNVKAAVVAKALKKIRASKRLGGLVAILRVEGARIPLIEFDAREKKVKSARGPRRAVSVKVLVGGERKVVAGGFVGTHGGSGTRGIFKRTGRGRYPIKYRRSVSIPQAFTNETVLEVVKRVAAESFRSNFAQQIRFLGSR